MSYNTFGSAFRFTTWGESHGPAIGCVIDGVPPGLALDEQDIQRYLDLRRPGSSAFTTQRNEPDTAKILSGVFEGRTTGTPVSVLIENQDTRSKDYGNIASTFRPGHADYTYFKKYGLRDYRGGGRSSARETAMRVAAGAIARKILGDGIRITGAMIRMGKSAPVPPVWDEEEITRNPFFCPHAETAKRWEQELLEIRKRGSSVGALLEVRAEGVPSGLGAPLYHKLDADLASAFMSINAVKGVEIGDGFASAELYGEENADEMIPDPESPEGVAFLSNRAGGILGGISTGAPVVVRFAVKPTSSILIPRRSVTESLEAADVFTKGRHDPCVGIRAVPVGEAMMACVLADHLLMHRAQCGGR